MNQHPGLNFCASFSMFVPVVFISERSTTSKRKKKKLSINASRSCFAHLDGYAIKNMTDKKCKERIKGENDNLLVKTMFTP